jgi:hypothetical protein
MVIGLFAFGVVLNTGHVAAVPNGSSCQEIAAVRWAWLAMTTQSFFGCELHQPGCGIRRDHNQDENRSNSFD